jgi:hypothetical protein
MERSRQRFLAAREKARQEKEAIMKRAAECEAAGRPVVMCRHCSAEYSWVQFFDLKFLERIQVTTEATARVRECKCGARLVFVVTVTVRAQKEMS